MTDPKLRASDADRERVIGALESHTAAGRLTLDEFADRVSRVLAAVTNGDLAAATKDLPANPQTTAPIDQVVGAQHRQLAVAFLLAALTLIVLGLVLAVAR